MRRHPPILRRLPSAVIVIHARSGEEAWAELTFLIRTCERFGATSADIIVRSRTA